MLRQRPQAEFGVNATKRTATSRPVSFRLPERLVQELKIEALRKGLDLSALGREIATDHLRWEELTRGLRFVPLPGQVLNALWESLSEEGVEQLGYDSGKDSMIQMILQSKGTLSLEGFLEVLSQWLEASSMTVRHTDGEWDTFVISHEMGRKWSLYLAALVKGVFEEIAVRTDVRFEARKGNLTFSLRKPHVY